MDMIAINPAFIRALEPRLLRQAERAVRSRAVAEDLVQETWMAAHQSFDSFGGRSLLSTWVSGILRRKIVDHFRRSKPVSPLEEERLTEQAHRPDEGRLDRTAALGVVERTLAALPDLERQAVSLCDVRQLDRDAAAAELGITRNHLRVLLHR